MSRAPSAKTVRRKLIAAIVRDVGWLVRRGRRDYLDALTELVGWIYNYTSGPATAQYGRVIVALAPVLPLDALIDVAHGAVFYRHLARLGSKRADEIADQELRDAGVDVDQRNAQLEA